MLLRVLLESFSLSSHRKHLLSEAGVLGCVMGNDGRLRRGDLPSSLSHMGRCVPSTLVLGGDLGEGRHGGDWVEQQGAPWLGSGPALHWDVQDKACPDKGLSGTSPECSWSGHCHLRVSGISLLSLSLLCSEAGGSLLRLRPLPQLSTLPAADPTRPSPACPHCLLALWSLACCLSIAC